MIQFKQLKVTFDYPPDFDKHNHDLVGYVIQKYPRKVVDAAVITRSSIESWYKNRSEKYPKKSHVILIGTISIMGIVAGVSRASKEDEEEFEDDADDTGYHGRRDPSAN